MKIKVNDILVLENNQKALVLADTLYNGYKYYYLAEVTNDEKEVTENVKIVKEMIKDDNKYISEIENESEFKIVCELLEKSLVKNNPEETVI